MFIAIAGGSALALSGKNSVKHDDLANNVVRSAEIKKGQVKSSDIATGAVGSAEIKDGKVKTKDYADGSVDAEALDAVPAARIKGSGEVLPNQVFTSIEGMTDSAPAGYDPFDMWEPSEPGKLTVPIDGVYVATGNVNFAVDDTASPGLPNDNGHRLMQVSAGAGDETARVVVPPNRFDSESTALSATVVASLEAGDQIRLHAEQTNDDASSNTLLEAKLAVTWVGPLP